MLMILYRALRIQSALPKKLSLMTSFGTLMTRPMTLISFGNRVLPLDLLLVAPDNLLRVLARANPSRVKESLKAKNGGCRDEISPTEAI